MASLGEYERIYHLTFICHNLGILKLTDNSAFMFRSPIQNNLYEYYRMASWVSPGCLDTEAHFTKTFHDPIMDGMAADCSPAQAEKQEQVSNAMHSILSKFVHRRDADVLARDLPFLQETIIHVR